MRSDRVALIAGVSALIAVFLWIYLPFAALWPWGADAERWLGQGDPARPGWTTWVFGTRHFVGYRPVAALSFALDARFVHWPPASHWIDFTAMIGVIAGIVASAHLLVRPFSTPGRAAAAGLLAGALVVFHPVLQEIVPYVPRRSYVLAESAGLVALASFLAGVRAAPGTWWLGGWNLAAAVAMGLACGSNEAIFPLACLMPVLGIEAALARGISPFAGMRSAVFPLLVPALLAVTRNFVLPDDNRTGYVKKWFAYTDGQNRLLVLDQPEPGSVFSAAWSYVLFPSAPGGDVALFSGALGVVAVLFAVWLFARGVLDPLVGYRDPARRLPLWLLAWGALTAALYAIANTWFWREGFPLLVPVALAITVISAFDLAPGRPWWRRLSTGAALATLAVSIGWWSPAAGVDLSPLGEEVRATRVMTHVYAARERLPARTIVWMIPQGDPEFGRELERAANASTRGSGLLFRLLGTVPRKSDADRTADVSAVAVTLPPGGRIDDRLARQLRVPKRTTVLQLDRLSQVAPYAGEIWWWEGPLMAAFHTAPISPDPDLP